MNAKKVMRQKLQVNLDMTDVAKAMERAINQLPILTEAEVDELRDASEDMLNRMVDKGCGWGWALYARRIRIWGYCRRCMATFPPWR